MKRNLLLFALLFSFMATFAAQQTATLQSGDSFTPFYGPGALIEAYAQAVEGDVINLSAGSFEATDIEKGVTIIGVYGFSADVSKATSIASFNITADNVKLEGLYLTGTLTIKGADNLTISRCTLQVLSDTEKADHKYHDNTIIMDCLVRRCNSMSLSKNAVFRNSCINYFYDLNEAANPALIENCNIPLFARCSIPGYFQPYAIYRNCLLGLFIDASGTHSSTFAAPFEFSNCLFVKGRYSTSYNTFNLNFNCKTENCYSYTLSSTIVSTIDMPRYDSLGDYSVSTYGPVGPIEPKYYPSIPTISSAEIDTQTDADGNLHVKISATARD